MPSVLRKLLGTRLTKVVGSDLARWLDSGLARGAAGTLAVNGFSLLQAPLIAFILARQLGDDGYGLYSFVLAWITLLSVIAGCGLDKLVVRTVAMSVQDESLGVVHGLLRWGFARSMGVSLMLVGATVGVVLWLPIDRNLRMALLVGTCLLPPRALMSATQGAVQGLGYVVRSLVPDKVIRPLVFVVVILLASFFELASPGVVLGLNAGVAWAMYAVTVWLLVAHLPNSTLSTAPVYDVRSWKRTSWPLLFRSVIQMANAKASIILLGLMNGNSATGIYAIATRAAELVPMALLAANMVIAPRIARLHAVGERERLQRLCTKTVRATTLVTLPLAAGLVVLGPWLLRFFGPNFDQGYEPMCILIASHLFNVGCGSVGLILVMTGHQRDAAIGAAVGTAISVGLNLALIPFFGTMGAAIGTASATVVWNAVLALLVYKRLGVNPTLVRWS